MSIENSDHLWRADVLRGIPARVWFIPAEPLQAPLPELDLAGFHWLIVGGESGPGYRPMSHGWERQLLDKARAAGVVFFFKQSAAPRTQMGAKIEGCERKEYPRR